MGGGGGGGGSADLGGTRGAERTDCEVRGRATAGGGFLVFGVHRFDIVVADCARLSRSAPPSRRLASAICEAHQARDSMAAGTGASAFLPSAAKPSQRLGRHHAALGVRSLYEHIVVFREAALRHRARGGDAREFQRTLPSVFGGDRRVSRGPTA